MKQQRNNPTQLSSNPSLPPSDESEWSFWKGQEREETLQNVIVAVVLPLSFLLLFFDRVIPIARRQELVRSNNELLIRFLVERRTQTKCFRVYRGNRLDIRIVIILILILILVQ